MSQYEAYSQNPQNRKIQAPNLSEWKLSTGVSSAMWTHVLGFQVHCEFNILSHCPHQSSRIVRAGVLVFSLEIMPRFHSSDNFQELACGGSGFTLSFEFSVVTRLGFGKWGNQERVEIGVNCDI